MRMSRVFSLVWIGLAGLSTLYAQDSIPAKQDAPLEAKQVYTLSELDEIPNFARGKMNSSEFLRIYQKYPEQAQVDKVQGTVIFSLIIDKDGEVTSSKMVQSVNPDLDAEAERLISLLPYYTPGYKDGQPVTAQLTFPIKFRLEKDTSTLKSAPQVAAANIDNQQLTPAEVAELKAHIRTQSTAEQKAPLYIIDGEKVYENIDLNASAIESIRVIKGSKAIQLYGANAKNGVVIITTKNFPDS